MSRLTMLRAGPVTRQAVGRLRIATAGPGFVEVTGDLHRFVAEAGIDHGLLTVFCRHTSASLALQENADPDVRADLMAALDRLAPRDAAYLHDAEGPDDMPAHLRAVLTGVTLVIPVVDGTLALGTWQGAYLVEHRDRPHQREILLHLSGA